MNGADDLLAFSMPSGAEWVVILLVVLLFFGAAKLPELAKGLGQAIKEFKKASKEEGDDSGEPPRPPGENKDPSAKG